MRSGPWHRVHWFMSQIKLAKARCFCYVTSPCITFLISVYITTPTQKNLNYYSVRTYPYIYIIYIDGCIYTHITSRSSSNDDLLPRCHPFLVTFLWHHHIVQPYRHGGLHLNASVFLRRTRMSSSSPLTIVVFHS
jgi:hypothetical protein